MSITSKKDENMCSIRCPLTKMAVNNDRVTPNEKVRKDVSDQRSLWR
jgi:hypothetical protein